MIKQYSSGVWICVILCSQVVFAKECWRPEPNPNNDEPVSHDCEHHNDVWFYAPFLRDCIQPKDDDILKDQPNLCLKEGYFFESESECEKTCSFSKWNRKSGGKVRRGRAV